MNQIIKTKLATIILLLAILSGCYCKHEGKHVVDVIKENNKITVITNKGKIQFTPITDSSVEVEYIREGIKKSPSYAIAAEPGTVEASFDENRQMITYSTPGVTVKIKKCPLHISYYKGDSLLFSEEQGLLYNDSIKGFRMQLQPQEMLMGGGERVIGMNRRGNRLRLYNQASYGYQAHAELMYYSMPVVISSNKYMLVFDNAADGWLDLGKTEPGILKFETIGGRMSYIVVSGENYRSLTENYVKVTGYQPMPPRWALGNITSRMGYTSQAEVKDVVALYKKQDFPLDALVLDIYWFGPDVKGYMGNLEWDKTNFPEPEQMMKKIKDEGVKTILITEPFILTNSGKYNECAGQGLFGTDSAGKPYIFDFYFGTTALLDIFKPETKKWFWGIYKKHTLSGVDGWWGDLGEPEVHPADLQHVNGAAGVVHNAFGHEWAKTIYNGFKKDFPQQRPVILMRAGFAGSQRYGMIPWSGDVSRSWGGLKSQVEIALQMGMQGLAYMHSDLGGFAGAYKDAELYIRWLQYGVFQPIYRTHAQSIVPPEPVFWDKQTQNIVRKFIKLRYALTPYLYTMVYQNSTMGTPLMRPLFYIDNNPELINNSATYLWGDNFLVSPVTEKGAKEWTVTLPQGANWYNFFTSTKHNGGQNVTMPVTINEIPVFVKGGAFIPMVVPVENMEEYSTKKLILHYYHDEEVQYSSGFMYEDDGKTNQSWKNKQYEILRFKSGLSKHAMRIGLFREGYEYSDKPQSRDITLIVHNISSKPHHILVGETEKKYTWNANTLEAIVEFNMKGDAIEVVID